MSDSKKYLIVSTYQKCIGRTLRITSITSFVMIVSYFQSTHEHLVIDNHYEGGFNLARLLTSNLRGQASMGGISKINWCNLRPTETILSLSDSIPPSRSVYTIRISRPRTVGPEMQ